MILGTVLLIIGGVGLVLTLLSLFGAEIGDVDIDLGDSSVGLLSIVTPFATGFGLLGGGLIVFADTGILPALLVGLVTGIVLSLAAVAVLGFLVGSEEELPSIDVLGSRVRVVEPVSPGRYGVGEIQTPLGAQQVTITCEQSLAHDAEAVIVEKVDDRDGYIVAPLDLAN
ncbi:hypothetical protein [Gordonia shandongensis]|uniref:hypothetical protein n=1 Tax=Gordonia shandongensis TaxID=376351 RepID=UPI0003FDF12C|nr:hypothetical protein [Gordonia shandongensis]